MSFQIWIVTEISRDPIYDMTGKPQVWASRAEAEEQIRLLSLTGNPQGDPINFNYVIVDTDETVDQFARRMQLVELKEQFEVGHTCWRELWEFEGQHVMHETYTRLLPSQIKANKGRPLTPAQLFHGLLTGPRYYWVYNSRSFYGKDRAEAVMKQYGADSLSLDPYPARGHEDKWHSLVFKDTNKNPSWPRLMQLIYDIHTGVFAKTWGADEPVKYRSLFDDQREERERYDEAQRMAGRK